MLQIRNFIFCRILVAADFSGFCSLLWLEEHVYSGILTVTYEKKTLYKKGNSTQIVFALDSSEGHGSQGYV